MQSDFKYFFAHDTGSGIQASFANKSGRKNHRIRHPKKPKEPVPLAIETFAQNPDDYAELMTRVESFLTRGADNEKARNLTGDS